METIVRLLCSLPLSANIAELDQTVALLEADRSDPNRVRRLVASVVDESATERDVNEVCHLLCVLEA